MHYPTPEQLWYFRELLCREQESLINSEYTNKLTEDEQNLVSELTNLMNQADSHMSAMQTLIDDNFNNETKAQLCSELHPFARKGALYFGSAHYAEYGCDKLHEELARAFFIAHKMQKNNDTESEEYQACQEALQGFLNKLAEKLNVAK